MITITREFTKEQLQQIIETDHVQCGEASALARIALASLEAEAVAEAYQPPNVGICAALGVSVRMLKPLRAGDKLYVAPPAPVSVPDEMDLLTCHLDGVTETYAEGWNDCRSAMLQGAEPVTTAYKLQEETGSSLQLRYLIRQHHAEWSQATFGDVGPIGPLKHLSKEALEAAAEPDDLSEWADMQFLLWDAQRRAGISDGEITAAMEEKLKVNMARQWPEPKDGEPRPHIKAAPQQEAKNV